MVDATLADNVSLSPMTISSVDTVSFSLMTGSAPSSKSRASVLWKLLFRLPDSCKSGAVMRICATMWLYSVKSLS